MHDSNKTEPEGIVGSPKFVVSWAQVQVAWGCLKFVSGLKGDSLVKKLPLICRSALSLDSQCIIELNFRTSELLSETWCQNTLPNSVFSDFVLAS